MKTSKTSASKSKVQSGLSGEKIQASDSPRPILLDPVTASTEQIEKNDPKAFERAYKYKIVDLLARTMNPGWWDMKEKFTDQSREILQLKAKEKAIECLRAIAPYIKEPH